MRQAKHENSQAKKKKHENRNRNKTTFVEAYIRLGKAKNWRQETIEDYISYILGG